MAKQKIQIPKINGSSVITLEDGSEAYVNHAKAGYGKGGILSLTRADDGYSIAHIRYGSNGYADFGTLGDAKKSLTREVERYNDFVKKNKASESATSTPPPPQKKGYTSGAGGSNSGYKSGASGSGMYEDAPF